MVQNNIIITMRYDISTHDVYGGMGEITYRVYTIVLVKVSNWWFSLISPTSCFHTDIINSHMVLWRADEQYMYLLAAGNCLDT